MHDMDSFYIKMEPVSMEEDPLADLGTENESLSKDDSTFFSHIEIKDEETMSTEENNLIDNLSNKDFDDSIVINDELNNKSEKILDNNEIVVSAEKIVESKTDAVKNEQQCYQCPICKRHYINKEGLDAHVDLHTNGKGYQCQKCPKVFQTPLGFNKHYIKHCEKIYNCTECSFRGTRGIDLKKHICLAKINPSSAEQETLTSTLTNKSEVEKHPLLPLPATSTRSKITDKKFICDICNKMYSSEFILQKHKKFLHFNNESVTCPICSITLNSKDSYESHKRIHIKKNTPQCSKCGLVFSAHSKLELHNATLHGVTKFDCHICSKSFTKQRSLQLHISRHGWREEFTKEEIKCPDCSEVFQSESLLKKHQCKKAKKVSRKYVNCKGCGKKLMRCGLKGHLKLCEKRMKKLTEKKEVKEVKEPKEKESLICVVCNHKFSSSDILHKHQIITHVVNIDMEPHTKCRCKICFKIFSDLEFLKQHIQTEHDENVTEHLCDLCDSAFTSLNNLKAHYQHHEREDQYCCFYCLACFAEWKTLLSHEKDHIDNARSNTNKKS